MSLVTRDALLPDNAVAGINSQDVLVLYTMHQALFKMPLVSFPLSHRPKSTQVAGLGFEPRQQNSEAHRLGPHPRERLASARLPEDFLIQGLCVQQHALLLLQITWDVGVGVLQEPGGRWKIVTVSLAMMHAIEAHLTSQPSQVAPQPVSITDQAGGEWRSTAISLPPTLLPSVHPSIHPGTPPPPTSGT